MSNTPQQIPKSASPEHWPQPGFTPDDMPGELLVAGEKVRVSTSTAISRDTGRSYERLHFGRIKNGQTSTIWLVPEQDHGVSEVALLTTPDAADMTGHRFYGRRGVVLPGWQDVPMRVAKYSKQMRNSANHFHHEVLALHAGDTFRSLTEVMLLRRDETIVASAALSLARPARVSILADFYGAERKDIPGLDGVEASVLGQMESRRMNVRPRPARLITKNGMVAVEVYTEGNTVVEDGKALGLVWRELDPRDAPTTKVYAKGYLSGPMTPEVERWMRSEMGYAD